MAVPQVRVRQVNEAPVRPSGRYVLYWMIAARRASHSFSLDRALEHARALGRPLLVFEPVRVGYRWASRRVHRYVIEGMADNAAACAAAGVRYLPYVEPEAGAGSGLLEALAEDAALVVTDDFPCFFLPRMVAAAGEALRVRLEAVDSNGLYPLAEPDRDFTVAHSFRRHLQKTLRPHLHTWPAAAPLEGYDLGAAEVPEGVSARWPAADLDALLAGGLDALPIDSLAPVAERGGAEAARARLRVFLADGLPRYADGRNDPTDDVSSRLSAWLHFGHLGVHEVLRALFDRDEWTLDRLAAKPNGKREGWWGCSPEVEAFLDELITWRELGYAFCYRNPHTYDRYDSLPDWALQTLDEHRGDRREHVYDLRAFDEARTHDPLWNAAQRQLRQEGRIHNYLRMLWGKKILHWTASPEDALDVLIELNNRYAIDGRDPNSYSGIFWTLGRFDRAWGPERPIFGKVRYMTSGNTAKKVDVKGYLRRFGGR